MSPRVPFPANALPAEALHREREEAAAARRAGPGGGAIEGPPLLGRGSAGSAHGGLEYYRRAAVPAGPSRRLHVISCWNEHPGTRCAFV